MSTIMTQSRPRFAAPDHSRASVETASLPRDVAVRPAVDATRGVDIRDVSIPGGPAGQLWMRMFRPVAATGTLPVILYVHGVRGGFGDGTHDLVTKLAIDLRCAVVVLYCDRAAAGAAIEQIYAAAAWIAAAGFEHDLDHTRIALAANSAGAAAADELMLMADRRGGPSLAGRVLLSARTMAALRAALAA